MRISETFRNKLDLAYRIPDYLSQKGERPAVTPEYFRHLNTFCRTSPMVVTPTTVISLGTLIPVREFLGA